MIRHKVLTINFYFKQDKEKMDAAAERTVRPPSISSILLEVISQSLDKVETTLRSVASSSSNVADLSIKLVLQKQNGSKQLLIYTTTKIF